MQNSVWVPRSHIEVEFLFVRLIYQDESVPTAVPLAVSTASAYHQGPLSSPNEGDITADPLSGGDRPTGLNLNYHKNHVIVKNIYVLHNF